MPIHVVRRLTSWGADRTAAGLTARIRHRAAEREKLFGDMVSDKEKFSSEV